MRITVGTLRRVIREELLREANEPAWARIYGKWPVLQDEEKEQLGSPETAKDLLTMKLSHFEKSDNPAVWNEKLCKEALKRFLEISSRDEGMQQLFGMLNVNKPEDLEKYLTSEPNKYLKYGSNMKATLDQRGKPKDNTPLSSAIYSMLKNTNVYDPARKGTIYDPSRRRRGGIY